MDSYKISSWPPQLMAHSSQNPKVYGHFLVLFIYLSS